MVSHKKVGDFEFSLSAKGGLRFKKAPTLFNQCVGNEMKGMDFTDRQSVRDGFGDAAATCKKKLKAPAKKAPAKAK